MMRNGLIAGLLCALMLGLPACDVPGAAGNGNGNVNVNTNTNTNTNTNNNGPNGQPSLDPFGFSLKIARHVDQPLTESELDTIFAVATSLLQRQDFECPDMACPVTFGRSGPIGTFDVGSTVITSESALDDAFDVSGDIKVVTSMVGVCGISAIDDTAVILGCAFTSGSVVIVREADPDVWAHEWGHVQGLDHRDNCPRNLMHSFELQTNAVDASECQALLTPTPAAFTLSFFKSGDKDVSLDGSADTINGRDALAELGQSVDPSLRRFDESRREWLSRITAPRYIAGLPSGAIRYCNDDQVCGELTRMVGETGSPVARRNMVRALGLTDDPMAVDTILGMLENASGPMSVHQFNIYAEALLAAGRLANTDASGAALAYLQQAAFDEFWANREVRLDSQTPLSEAMASIAIKALGLTESTEAAGYLALLMESSESANRRNQIAESLGRFVPVANARVRLPDDRQP